MVGRKVAHMVGRKVAPSVGRKVAPSVGRKVAPSVGRKVAPRAVGGGKVPHRVGIGVTHVLHLYVDTHGAQEILGGRVGVGVSGGKVTHRLGCSTWPPSSALLHPCMKAWAAVEALMAMVSWQ